MRPNWCYSLVALGLLFATGCHALNYSDQGTLLGGATGAGVGALIGDATGNAGTGALLGAGIGAISGNLIGNGLDEVEAKNRAAIAAHMGRTLPPGGVQPHDIVAMTSAGVDEELIVNHIRANGVAVPLQAQDVIALQQQGVSKPIIAALQTAPRPQLGTAPMGTPPGAMPMAAQPMMVAPGYYYPPPYYAPPPWRVHPHFFYSHHHHRPRSSIGFSFSN